MRGGPTFHDLATGPANDAPSPALPVGGALSNDHAREAIKTNPIQAARIKREMSKAALMGLAHDLSKARHVV